jgi:hypothetical protein
MAMSATCPNPACRSISNTALPHLRDQPDKKKRITELKKLAKSAETVWLASDEDREGEAISWHLCQALGLDPKTTKRIAFHEITKHAIERAIANPAPSTKPSSTPNRPAASSTGSWAMNYRPCSGRKSKRASAPAGCRAWPSA